MEQLLLGLVLAATCAYAFLNGFRDVSNSVAAAVRTRSLTPTIAVLVAAFFAFVGTMLSQAFGAYLVSAVELNVPDPLAGAGDPARRRWSPPADGACSAGGGASRSPPRTR